MKFFSEPQKNNRGMTLLISVLIVSTILGVALSLLSFVIKQFKISSSSQQSVISLYAADAGSECALLWDIRGFNIYNGLVFATSSETYTETPPTPAIGGNGVLCFGQDLPNIPWTFSNMTANSATTEFKLDIPDNLNPTSCVIVTVTKDSSDGPLETSILSQGYNVPCDQINTSPIAVERAIRVNYTF